MYDDEDDIPECPLCLDPLELDDVSFYPCTCGYQVCRFCWHRIRTDENGLCPQCRKPYSEDPVRFKPLSNEEIQKMKKDRDRRAKEKKGNALDCRKHLANLRVVQPNLLFVVGLTQRMADADVLKRSEYFGRYGKINKLSVTVTSPSNTTASNNSASSQASRFSATCHVTYAKAEDALRALLFLDQSQLDSRTLRISIGTTKYCSNFVKGNPCHRKDCTYLHEVGPSDASFTKENMQEGKHVEYERRLLLEFVARNPHLAQQVDISKINNKTLTGQANSNFVTDNTTSVPPNQQQQQVQPLLNTNENASRNGTQSSQVSNGAVKTGSQINNSASTQKPQQHQPRSITTAASSTASNGSNNASQTSKRPTNTNGISASSLAASSSSSTVRNRSGSASGKHSRLQQSTQPQSKSNGKSKDDTSIVSSPTSSPAPSTNNGNRSSRSKNGAIVMQSSATSTVKSSLLSKSTDVALVTGSSVSAGVKPSSSTSSVLKPGSGSATSRQNTARTSRLTTPDEPVWWGLDNGEAETDLVSSSSASTSPTMNGIASEGVTNGKTSPHNNNHLLRNPTSHFNENLSAKSGPNASHVTAPSPLLTHGIDSGFVSSSSSTGGSEPSSMGLPNHAPQFNGVALNNTNTLVSLFSSAASNGGDSSLFGNSSSLATVDKAIAAILHPAPSERAPVQSQPQPPAMQPGRPIDLKDILRSCAGMTLGSAPAAQPSSDPYPSNASDCCDDLDVDPMEESIRRLNDLMAAEQRKKQAAQPITSSNYSTSSGYSLFQQTESYNPKPYSSQPPPGIPLQNGFGMNRIMHQPQQQQHQPQSSNYPSISSSSLFASYQHQQQHGALSSSSSNGQSHSMSSSAHTSHYNSNGASWPSFNSSAYDSYANQQQRAFSGSLGFANGASNESPNLANWLLPSINHQQHQPINSMGNGYVTSSNQQHSNGYSMQQSSNQRSSGNDYMATVFAAAGKRV